MLQNRDAEYAVKLLGTIWKLSQIGLSAVKPGEVMFGQMESRLFAEISRNI
ncbi:hypothetical protein D3C74_500230 [compost metagenome]